MKYPIGVQNFEKIRKEGYGYVDKTAHIYNLVKSGTYYFLSRPRRFGKSLLLSTIESYFKGQKHLFEGLAIEQLETEWKEYPVLHFDLNAKKFDTLEDLYDLVGRQLERYELQYDTVAVDQSLDGRFYNLIMAIAEKTGKKTVVLVDEYDKPLLQAIGNPDLQNAYRDALKAFYGVMKSCDGQIHFGFLTGVTKFGKVSVFSDLNNLNDLSMDAQYYDICGISEEELLSNFDESIRELAVKNDQTYEEACARLRTDYDGYHFSEDVPGMYNPFSVLNAFFNNKFGSYWFETGTPSYLVELLKRHDFKLDELKGDEVTANVLSAIDASSSNPIPVIFQSGYLTISGYDEEFKLYSLDFPNEEVREGFMLYLMPYYTSVSENKTGFQIRSFVREVKSGDITAFMTRLESFFANTPYDLIKDTENHYQNVLFILCNLCGLYTKAEFHTSNGRVDMTIETPDYVYIFEFKYNGTAEEAMAQIKEKNYAQPFLASGKKIALIGANFSGETRNIEKYLDEWL